MLGAQLLNWGVARRYSEARCTWVQPSRNDRPSEEEVRNRKRIHHNFHLLLRAACSVLLHPNPSAHLTVRLLQWAQSTGFVPCSSFPRSSFPRAGRVVLHKPPRYPTSHTAQPPVSFSKPLIHPPSAIFSPPARCSHAAAGMPKSNRMGSHGRSGRLPIKSCSRPRSSTPVAHRSPSVLPARIALLPSSCSPA